MAIQVHVPVAVRIGSGRLAPIGLADLEVGTGDALALALDTVREEVLTPRGHERVVSMGEASLQFAHDVEESLRPPVALAVQRSVDYAVAHSGLRAWYRPVRPVAALTGPPQERMDPVRRGDGTYSIQLFDDGTPAAVITFTPQEVGVIVGGPLTDHEAASLAWQAHLQRFGPEWNPGAYGYPGFYGSFTHNGKLLRSALLYIFTVESCGEDGWPIKPRWQIGGFDMLQHVEDTDDTVTIVRQALRPTMDHWVITRTTEPTDFATILRRSREANAQRPEAERLSEKVLAEMARIGGDFAAEHPGAAIWTAEDGNTTRDVVLEAANEGGWGIAHSPIRFIVETQVPGTESGVDAGGKHEGKGGTGEKGATGAGGREGRGRGRRGGPLGLAEGHGSRWPVLGLGGEPLACTSFLGEPPVHQLADGAKFLDAQMRDLASALEVDYCGYAGMFCLNLARLIGARAHAIGVTSIYSTMTTSVTARPDGGGNNGFVDIRPGESPELEYMKALGDLAVRVQTLADDISRTYRAEANRQLIYWDDDHQYDPDPVAWSVRFWIELSDIMTTSCMWLYAETCRAMLLQQLRSSHSAIVARQDQFPDTRRRFDEALGILGESAVKLSVLKTAISHARRLGLTGSVREVLSQRPPPRRWGKDEMIWEPAPMESMAPQLIDVLTGAGIERHGGNYVARWDGRLWTTSDLEQGASLRRSLLNMVDPLFFQVSDLDQLYNQFRINPSSSETYLRELLNTMRQANEEMTREASSWEEGAFFALEASQWVAAKGGVNSQGLHYDLQGIHKLADDALRPWAGRVYYYNEGLDRAISVKANWDCFVQVFSIAGVIALALLCAPLGAVAVGAVTSAASVVLALRDVAEADRLEDLYRSLEDPEAILSWQDVELSRLMADLSVAFLIFEVTPLTKGAKAIVAGTQKALREVAEQGLRGAARATLRSARRAVLANMTEQVLRNALQHAVTSAAVAGSMQLVLPTVITPVLVPWMRGIALEHGTLTSLDAALGNLTAGQPATPQAVLAELPADIELPEDAVEKLTDTTDPGTLDVGSPGEEATP